MNSEINDSDLFTNTLMLSAMKSLSSEDVARYKDLGKQLYGSLDFPNSKVLETLPAPIQEAVAYINEQLKSGLHPSMMEDNEKAVMVDAYGDEWCEKYGYVKEDLDDLVTVDPKNPKNWQPKAHEKAQK